MTTLYLMDLAADARARIYGCELRSITDRFAGQQFTSDRLAEFLAELGRLADRMTQKETR